MSLELHFHPLSSFCQKALMAFYENDTPFEPHIVDFSNETSRDDARDRTIPESSIIIEYLAQHYPGATRLVPADADLARQTRMRDRFYDLYVNQPMQKVVTDRLRPAGQNDPYGVDQAKAQLHTAYGMIDGEMATKTWAMGDAFTMADCAAAPADVLREPRDAVRRHSRARGGVLPPSDGAPLVRPGRQRSRAVPRALPEVERVSTRALRRPAVGHLATQPRNIVRRVGSLPT